MALWRPAEGVRTDHALESGAEISPHYDSMIAKVIAHGATRDEARERLAGALDGTVALGVATNKAFLAAVLREEEFAAQGATTDFLGRFSFAPAKPDARTLGIAAMLLARKAGYGEWSSWSNNPARVTLGRLGDEDVALGSRTSEPIGRACAARTSRSTAMKAVVCAIEPDTVHLARGGESFRLDVTTHAPPAKRAAGPSDGRLVAPMNGRVVAVNAKAGETAAAGHALVVLEAMKMEHALSLSAPARVKAVHVAVGAQVSPGQLLVELEPAS